MTSDVETRAKGDAHYLWGTIFGLAVLRSVLPDLINSLGQDSTTAASVTQTLSEGRVDLASNVALALDVTLAILAIIRLISFVTAVPERPPPGTLWLLAAMGTSYAIFFGTTGGFSRSIVVFGSVTVALLLSPPLWDAVASHFALYGGILLAASWLVVAWRPDNALFAVDAEEGRYTLLDGERLAGVFTHPNMLAYWSLAVMCVALSQRELPLRRILFLLAVSTTLASGSRTSLITTLVVVILFSLRRFLGRPVRGALVIAFAAVSAFPLVASLPFELGGREAIWEVGRLDWQGFWPTGHGLYFWQAGEAQARGYPDFAFHAHHQILDTLVLSGAVVIPVVGFLSYHAWKFASWTTRSDFAFPALSLALLTQTLTEVPIQFLLLDPRAIIVVVATLSLSDQKGPHATRHSDASAQRSTPDREHGAQRRLAARAHGWTARARLPDLGR